MEVAETNLSKEQEDFQEERVCVDQILAMKVLVEEYLGKGKKYIYIYIYSTFTGLENSYDRAERNAVSNVLKIYRLGR